MLLLLIGCIAVTVKICQYADEGKLDRWLEEDYDDTDYEDEYYEDSEEDYYEDFEEEEDYYEHDDFYDEYSWEDDYDFDEPLIDYDDLEEEPSTDAYFSYDTDNRTDGLSYQVEMYRDDYFDEGESGDSYYSTYIEYFYPVVVGDVPNVDIINDTIKQEVGYLLAYYENDYKPYITQEEDGLYAELYGRVAFMSEQILSVVFQECIVYSDGYTDYYVYCLNFDMETGVLMDHVEILDIDEEFAAMFRERSEIQNGSFEDIEYMSDRELMEAMNSQALILFYVPQGMEVGLNTEYGWVSITLDDYEKYLKSI